MGMTMDEQPGVTLDRIGVALRSRRLACALAHG
jgi:hypothetical protein